MKSQWPAGVVVGSVVERKTTRLSGEAGDISIKRCQTVLRSKEHYHVKLRSEGSSEAMPLDTCIMKQVSCQLIMYIETSHSPVQVNLCVPAVCVSCDITCQVKPAQRCAVRICH